MSGVPGPGPAPPRGRWPGGWRSLRGVTLAGVDSVLAPLARRKLTWQRLARDLDPAMLETMIEEVPLARAIERAQALMQGQVRGRIVISL